MDRVPEHHLRPRGQNIVLLGLGQHISHQRDRNTWGQRRANRLMGSWERAFVVADIHFLISYLVRLDIRDIVDFLYWGLVPISWWSLFRLHSLFCVACSLSRAPNSPSSGSLSGSRCLVYKGFLHWFKLYSTCSNTI
jgi:hypothetical protein